MSSQVPSPYLDHLPDDHEYLTYIKKVLRHRCRQAGFRRITTSLLENAETCQKALNANKDELEKYGSVVNDSLGNAFMLRFDPVVSIARAFIEKDMKSWPQPVELFFIDNFVTKTPTGSLSSDLDFGVQLIGSNDAALTAQVIYLAHKILHDLGLRELFTVQINHIGSLDSRKLYLEDLKNFYFDKQRSLCEKCLKFMEKGDYLQLLRCDEEDCSILAQLAPKLENYLNKDDRDQYESLKGYLQELEVGFRENKNLFGYGNYNANTVFEFWHNDKGAKQVIIGGGSNDMMIERLGGDKSNMIGFSSNASHLIECMRETQIRVPHKDHLQIFVAQLGLNAKKKALFLLQKLRESGIQAVGAMGTGSMRVQLDMASHFKVKYTLLMGEIEVNEGMVIVRDMEFGTQETVPFDRIVEIMQERIGREKMDVMEEGEKSVDVKKGEKKKVSKK
jgi:histidyl-tRNA synthetase